MTILAGILSLGNITFETTDSDILKVSETSRGWLKATAVSFLFVLLADVWQHTIDHSSQVIMAHCQCDSSQPLLNALSKTVLFFVNKCEAKWKEKFRSQSLKTSADHVAQMLVLAKEYS